MILQGKYNFKVMDELIANFHVPYSTCFSCLHLLGVETKSEAFMKNEAQVGYRFFNYGDSCFFSKQDEEGKK
jgi:S-adenosylmethionine:tRNA ribosyltransferase-isomerase